MAFKCETCEEYKPESKRRYKLKSVCTECVSYKRRKK